MSSLVAKFIDGQIGFTDITYIIRKMMESHKVIENPDVDTILAVQNEVYQRIG